MERGNADAARLPAVKQGYVIHKAFCVRYRQAQADPCPDVMYRITISSYNVKNTLDPPQHMSGCSNGFSMLAIVESYMNSTLSPWAHKSVPQ